MELKGKRVVVTGASSGIGREYVRSLLSSGAKVVGVARNGGRIADEFGKYGVRAISCDVRKPEEVDRMLAETVRLLGGIDIFIANAGMAYYGPIGPADWEKNLDIFRLNVLSPIYTLQKLTEGRKEPLTFVITVSGLGKMVLPGFAFYDATKFALDGFIRTYWMEQPKHVRLMAVYPVATYTSFFRKAGGDDTPMPVFPRQSARMVAESVINGLKVGVRSVYPSVWFVIRCIIARVLPVDLIPQGIELVRFKAWRKRHGL